MNKNEELLPYYEKAKELLNYDAETGIFTWKSSTNRSIKIGSKAGSDNGVGYIQIKVDGKNLKAHRIAWFFVHGELPNVIDHINHVTDDNRIENLRSCTSQENNRNVGKRSDNKSGYKGVCWCKRSCKWLVQIRINSKLKHLGYFDCPKEASEAYENKAKEIYGEFYYGKI